jgi:hypothetical protein
MNSLNNQDEYSSLTEEKDETALNNFLINNNYTSELGSFPYIPPKFLGIDTKLFGSSNPKLFKVHPFLQLKEKTFDRSINHNDRMQAVRYMCRIPYVDHIKHCIESVNEILSDPNINPYDKVYFFSNNDKFMKLDDHIVYKAHEFFFNEARKNNYPLELILLSARYIISNYHYEDDVRFDVLEYILDIADYKNETVYARSECADILANCGEGDEVFFGYKVIKELGDLFNKDKTKTIYTNAQNVHTETIEKSVKNIIRSLNKQFYNELLSNKYTIENDLNNLNIDIETQEQVNKFLFRLMTDPSRYERLSLADIMVLVYYKIKTFDNNTQNTCIQRLLEECKESLNTCTSGYLTRIINVLSGFIEGEEFSLRISPEEELKSAVFARIQTKIRNLPDMLRNDILESLSSEDKSMFDEFLEIHSPEDELWNEYKDIITEEKFKEVFNMAIKIYKGEL